MKIALATIALIAAIPLGLLAEKDKDKDVKVEVKVPDKSGVTIENIATPPGTFSFTVKNQNNYAVHVSGNYFQAYGFHPFETDIKANNIEIITGGTTKGTELNKIVIEKVEKKEG